MEKVYIYLDDIRTPVDPKWIVVRNYKEFADKVTEIGLENIHTISLDHDLGDSAMHEFYNNVNPNYKLDYSNIQEKTGYDAAKWLIEHYHNTTSDLPIGYSKNKNPNLKVHATFVGEEYRKKTGITFPQVYTHSANPIGSANIMGYVNNFLMRERQPQSCIRIQVEHTI